MEIRRASTADAHAAAVVFDAAVRAGWRHLGDRVDEPMFTAEQWEEQIVALSAPNGFLVATDEDGRVLGMTGYRTAEGEVFLLFVHPDAAGRGVGRALLEFAHEALRDAGRTEAFLYTHEANERARAVYEAAGYRPDGTVRESDFRGVALREPRYVKVL